MTKRPVGRPKRPDDGRLRRLLSIRLSDAEYRWVLDHTNVESRREILLAGRKDDDGLLELVQLLAHVD